jgi:hypothetical protein
MVAAMTGAIADIASALQLVIEEVRNQCVWFPTRHSAQYLHRTCRQTISRTRTHASSDHDIDTVLDKPLGKQAGNMRRSMFNGLAKDSALYLIRVYEQKLIRMPEMLRDLPSGQRNCNSHR